MFDDLLKNLDCSIVIIFIDKTAEYVHKWLSHNKLVKANLKFLERQLCGYKNENILEKVQDNSKMFWVAQISDDDYEIRPKVDVTFCKDHINNGHCRNRNCCNLHLCKKFMWSPTACNQDPCKFIHSIKTDHNQKILRRCFPSNYADNTKLKVLRASFPRICEEFLNYVTCSKPFCGYYHICQDFVEGLCVKTCPLAKQSGKAKTTMHNFALNHNKRVFKMFNESMEVSREAAAKDIIMLSKVQVQSSIDQEIPSLMSVSSGKPQATKLKAFPSQLQLSSNPYTTTRLQRLSSAASMPNVSGLNISSPQFPDQINVSICQYYLNGNCRNKKCQSLHLCKEFLLGEDHCNGSCKYGFSHDPYNSHNKAVIDRCNLLIPPHQIVKILQQSFPRVCQHYQKGKCTQSCKNLHLCLTYLQNNADCSGGCNLSHQMDDLDNKTIFDLYQKFHGMERKTEFMRANILFAKSNSDTIEEKIPLFYDNILGTPEGFKDLGEVVQPDIIHCFKEELNDYFRLVQHNGQNLLYACPKNVKPCTHYWQKDGTCKMGNQCSMLHICKRQIFNEGGCNSGDCRSNHDFEKSHEKDLLVEHNLQYLSQEQLLTMLRHRYPVVCTQYLRRKCNSQSTCPNVHVCKRFLQGQCRIGAKCKFNHENGLRSRRLMKEYHISEDKFRFCVMLPKPRIGNYCVFFFILISFNS